MATRFIQQAQGQLNPGYNQQAAALQQQIPAIQQLYSGLINSLGGQQAQGNQSILENANARGVLNSTIPVVGQQQLGQQIIQQQGQYASQEAQGIAGVNSQIAGVRTEQASAISQLANALQGLYNQQQSLTLDQYNANRNYALQKQLQNQKYQLDLQAARL